VTVNSKAAAPRAPARGAKLLRALRSLHTYAGIPLLAFVVISSVTGLALGWKKNIELLQPPSQRGASTDLHRWRPLHELAAIAEGARAEHLPGERGAQREIDKMEVRNDRGIVKVIFTDYWEVQLDGATGEVKSVARRHSDWIEKLHDGSIVSDPFKLFAMTALALGLLALAASGFWLWYGPRRIRAERRRG
jgi:uncharacterized iron-regulated membrane protein